MQRFDDFYWYAHDNNCFNFFCFKATTNAPKRDSEYIDVDVRQSNHSRNKTTASVTWRNEAWGTKVPEYFKLVQESHL